MRLSSVIKFAIILIITLGLLAFFDGPIIIMFLTSLKYRADILTPQPKWIFEPTLSNYYSVLFGVSGTTLAEGPTAIRNSLLFVTSSTTIALLIGSLAAYGFSRFNFFGKNDLLFFILSQRFMPAIVIALPLYIFYGHLGLRGTAVGITLFYIAMLLPFAIWMMKGFFDEVPEEIDQAAILDGYSRFTVFLRFILPLTRNGFLATYLFSFIFAWQEFLFALLLTTPESWTIPIAIYNSRVSMQIQWGQICSYGTISIIPVFIIAVLAQKYLVRGMTLGAVK